MQLRSLLVGFLVWVLYPVWLLAGAADYLCHRRTDISHTSGATESWLHVAQFLCIGFALALAVLAEITLAAWIAMLAAVLLHSVLAYIDVRYTHERRNISPFEQHVHGYMEVIPLIAVCLVGLLHWPQLFGTPTQPASIDAASQVPAWKLILLGSFLLLAGVPVFEELVRSLRARAAITSASPPSDRTR